MTNLEFREIRKKLGLTQQGMANIIGVGSASINRMDNGILRVDPILAANLEVFMEIFDHPDIDPDRLLAVAKPLKIEGAIAAALALPNMMIKSAYGRILQIRIIDIGIRKDSFSATSLV